MTARTERRQAPLADGADGEGRKDMTKEGQP